MQQVSLPTNQKPKNINQEEQASLNFYCCDL
jgi:hypothetical protein